MSVPFKGVINVDVRDSVPDWTPFEPPRAPDGAPNVLYIVLDDFRDAVAHFGKHPVTVSMTKQESGGFNHL